LSSFQGAVFFIQGRRREVIGIGIFKTNTGFILFLFLSLFLIHSTHIAMGATMEENKPTMATKPSDGWTLHIDAKMHFPGKSDMIAHHYCKSVAGGLTQCQIYDSDNPDARLVATEVIVGPETYNKFDAKEKKLWHYHKTEIPKVDAKLPDLSADEAAKTVKSIEETYGKVYILWDPSKQDLPIGRPTLSILK
jgi:hypothetical protein